jgi:hypothetical protein
MSTHPNAMLILALTPDDLARKTYRAILADAGIEDGDAFVIGEESYHMHGVMESDYHESNQLALPEGTIYVFAHVTYGYGDKITWDELEVRKNALLEWGARMGEKFHCKAEIIVSANYW